MIVRTLSRLVRSLFTTVVIGSVAVPTVALAADPVVSTLPSAVSLTDRAIATDVVARAPVAAGAEFNANVGALFAWVEVRNMGDATTIQMVWKKAGKTRLTLDLPVGHSRAWKTWSKKSISVKDAGAWTVDVLDETGALIETLAFNVRAPADVSSK